MLREINFIINSEPVNTKVNPATTLLDFIRKEQKLTGTKEVCREGDCGACSVLLGEFNEGKLNYSVVNSCLVPVASAENKHVVTVEGLRKKELNIIQKSIIDEGAAQCGFCTPGFIISLTGYLINNNNYRVQDMLAALDGNICRCTGYVSLKRAAGSIIKNSSLLKKDGTSAIKHLIQNNILPEYFESIPQMLIRLSENRKQTKIKREAVAVAGGTDLFVKDWEALLQKKINIISMKDKYAAVWEGKRKIFINASATINDLMNSDVLQKYFNGLKEYFKYFGSQQIRNRATVGGNIINASPIGDSIIFFLALNATLHLSGGNSVREIALKDFYKGYKKLEKNNDELLDFVSIDIPLKNSLFNFEKVSKRTYLDIASVNTALYAEQNEGIITKLRISAGGIAPFPKLLRNTAEELTGRVISPDIIKKALEKISDEISPISDARGSAEYKTILLRQLIIAHFLKLFPGYIQAEVMV